jgi:hypothetical protein
VVVGEVLWFDLWFSSFVLRSQQYIFIGYPVIQFDYP